MSEIGNFLTRIFPRNSLKITHQNQLNNKHFTYKNNPRNTFLCTLRPLEWKQYLKLLLFCANDLCVQDSERIDQQE